METRKLLKYSMQLAMLGQLLARDQITETEYKKIEGILKKDYGIISELISLLQMRII